MVRFYFFISICFTLAGCKQQNNLVLVQNNESLQYVNYLEFTEYCLHFSHDWVNSDFCFDVTRQSKKTPIIGNDSLSIIKIIDNFYYNLYGRYDDFYVIDYSMIKREFFFCGKIPIVEGINSFLFLIEEPNAIHIGDVVQNLYLINCKGDHLTSIVNLSSRISSIDSGITTNTYLMGDLNGLEGSYFSQIYYFSWDVPLEYLIPKKVIEKYMKSKKNAEILSFSLFIIDENGFIGAINL